VADNWKDGRVHFVELVHLRWTMRGGGKRLPSDLSDGDVALPANPRVEDRSGGRPMEDRSGCRVIEDRCIKQADCTCDGMTVAPRM
jgi:hypothetical protein